MIRLYGVLFLSIFLYYAGCTNDVAGTISETDTGCAIAGIVHGSDGTAVSGAAVILHDQRNTALPVPSKRRADKSLQRSDTTCTDLHGFFLFDSVDTGRFLIEVSHQDSMGVIIPVTVGLADTLIKKQSVVQLAGTIAGKIDTALTGSSGKSSVIIKELGRVAPVDSSGYFVIGNLPEWDYHLSIIRENAIVASPVDTVQIRVTSGDTTILAGLDPPIGTTVVEYIMALNTNGRVGVITLDVADDRLSVKTVIVDETVHYTGTAYDTSGIWNGRSIPAFSFTTTSPTSQEWFGWLSWSRETAAGYYTEQGSQIRRPWAASVDGSDITAEITDTNRALDGYYAFDANGVKGRLLFERVGNQVTGSGILTESITGNHLYHTFGCSSLVIDTIETVGSRPVLSISFIRSDTLRQFTSRQSSDGNLIAGFFQDPDQSPAVNLPWFATRILDSADVAAPFEEITIDTASSTGGGVAFLENDSSLLLTFKIGYPTAYRQADIKLGILVTAVPTINPRLTEETAKIFSVQNSDTLLVHYRIADYISHVTYEVSADTTRFSGTIIIAGIPDNPSYRPLRISGSFDVGIQPKVTVVDNGTVTDTDGNVYRTVKIGNQEWMAENLRTTKYRDGTPLQHDTSTAVWEDDSVPKYCYYGNTTDADSIKKFGALYNWYVVNPGNPKKIAPAGWHVPTDAEWDTLQNYLVANGYSWEGMTTGNRIAKSLAAKTDWDLGSMTGTIGSNPADNNRTGFSALPGGEINTGFKGIGRYGCWWCATKDGLSAAFTRYLGYDSIDLIRKGQVDMGSGCSIRLVRD